MIKYSLKCSEGHTFDSWFQSAEAFEKLRAGGHLSCAVCGDTSVEKAIMAPRVRPARSAVMPVQDAPQPVAHMPDPQMQGALAEMKRKVEAEADYVGADFAREAREMHLGEREHRAIYGETRPDEAKSLLEDGVPVMPLPFTPTRKTN